MIQGLLIIFGLYCLITRKIKVSSRKEIGSPHSIILGLLFLVYAVGINYLPMDMLYLTLYYGSLVLFSIIIIVTGETKELPESLGDKKSRETKRNVIILILFILALILIGYFLV